MMPLLTDGPRVRRRLPRRWPALVGGLAVVLQTAAAVPRLLRSPPAVGRDGVFFQYVGQTPGLPYRQVWDVKPPLIHAISTGLHTVTGGPLSLHYASVALMIAVGTAVALLVAELASDVTESDWGALTAGVAWLAYPTVIWLPARGLRPKPIVLLFGFGALLALARDHHRTAVAAATLAAGLWQLAIIFPTIIAGAILTRASRRTQLHAAAIAATITLLTVSPYLSPPVFETMLVQVVATPVLFPESTGILERVIRMQSLLGSGWVALLFGTLGLTTLLQSPRDHWPMLAVTGWALLQLLALDLDGPPDLLLLYPMLALGVAVFVGRRDPRRRRLIVAACALALVGGLLHGPYPGAFNPNPTVVDAYWHQTHLDCHAQRSVVEEQFIKYFGASTGDCRKYNLPLSP